MIKLALLDVTLPEKESINSVKSEMKKSAEEILCVFAPICRRQITFSSGETC